jgi:hypothetical protein
MRRVDVKNYVSEILTYSQGKKQVFYTDDLFRLFSLLAYMFNVVNPFRLSRICLTSLTRFVSRVSRVSHVSHVRYGRIFAHFHARDVRGAATTPRHRILFNAVRRYPLLTHYQPKVVGIFNVLKVLTFRTENPPLPLLPLLFLPHAPNSPSLSPTPFSLYTLSP